MNRRGDGSIFGVRKDGAFTPLELVEAIATAEPGSRWTIDADDPTAFLRHVERVPLAIVREHEHRTPRKLSWIEGVGACHLFGQPIDAPPVFADAVETITQLGKLSKRVNASQRSDGGLVAMSVQVGFLLAMLHARNSEYFAYVGQMNDRNLASNRQGTPITAKASKLFSEGRSIRYVESACGVGYSVAKRWRKLFLENQ